jgi:hypothetical protein
MKLFSTLPSSIKSLNHDIKVYKPVLKDYLSSHSYPVEECKVLSTVNIYVNSCNNYVVRFVLVIVFVPSIGIRNMTCSTSLALTIKVLRNVNKFYSILLDRLLLTFLNYDRSFAVTVCNFGQY